MQIIFENYLPAEEKLSTCSESPNILECKIVQAICQLKDLYTVYITTEHKTY